MARKNSDEVLDFDVLDSMSADEAADAILGNSTSTPTGKGSKTGLSKLGRDARYKEQQRITEEEMIEKGRKLVQSNGWEGISKNTLRNIILGDEEYKNAKRELLYLKAHKADYEDSEQYKESVEKLETIIKYRAEIYANINSPKAKEERREARRSDPKVIELREKITVLRAMEKFLKPYTVANRFVTLTKEMILDGEIVMADADVIIDNNGMLDENEYMLAKNKGILDSLYTKINELKSKPDFASTFLKSLNYNTDNEDLYIQLSMLIYLILNSGETSYTFENIMILGNSDPNKLQKLLKENVDIFKSKYLKDDVGREFDDKLKELEKERRIAESEASKTRIGQFVHQKYNIKSEDIKEWETTGRMPKNLRQARELFTAEMIGNVYAIASYMCHVKGLDQREDVEDVAGAGTLIIAENLDDYLKEYVKTYEESGVFLSFNVFVGYKIYPEIQNAINQLRMRGMHGKTGNNFVYTMGVYTRLKNEMFRDHPDYKMLPDDELAEHFEVYVAKRIQTDSRLQKMIGDFNKMNGANFGLSLDQNLNGESSEDKRTVGDNVKDDNPLPDYMADFNMSIENAQKAVKRFFTEIRYIHRYDRKNQLFQPVTSTSLFPDSLVNYLSRKLAIVRDNPKTKREKSVFAGYYDNDNDIAAKIAVTPATISTYLNGKNNSLQDKLKDLIEDLRDAARDYPALSGYYRKLINDASTFLDFINKFVTTSKDANNADKKKKIERAKMVYLVAHLNLDESDIQDNNFSERNFPSKIGWKKKQ